MSRQVMKVTSDVEKVLQEIESIMQEKGIKIHGQGLKIEFRKTMFPIIDCDSFEDVYVIPRELDSDRLLVPEI